MAVNEALYKLLRQAGLVGKGAVALADPTKVNGLAPNYTGSASTRAAVRAQVGATPTVGSVYRSTAGKLYVKVANAGADTDWQKVTTTAAD